MPIYSRIHDKNLVTTVISVHLPARQITRIGQFLQEREKNFNRLPALADNLHPKTKENRRLPQSSFVVFVDTISFSVQVLNVHTFCLRCFIENDIKICSKKKSISRDLLSRRNRLKWENTFYLKAVLAKKISLMRRIFCRAN